MSWLEAEESPDSAERTQSTAGRVAAMAHDLRTPLVAVHMAVELLWRDLDELDAAQVHQMAVTIQRGTRWLQHLVENLHSLAELQEGRLAVERTPVTLPELLDECATMVGPALAAKGQDWAMRQGAPISKVLADRSQLGRVCMNLLMNASKFAAPDTLIEGVVTQDGDTVRVAIQDRGPGLSPDDAVRLFEPFFQASCPTPSGGVGLGLAIVRELVQAHGGRVGAENRRCGGARFWFELPAVDGRTSCPNSERRATLA